MLLSLHGMGVYISFFNILRYVQISQPIMVYFKLKNIFNNFFSIYIKQYYNYVM